MYMKRKKKFLCMICAWLVFAMCSLPVYAGETGDEDAEKPLAPYFFIEGADTSVDHFPLKDTQVSVNINGTIAETYVTQTYANEGQNPISATYVFPASTGVTVHGMEMQIGDQVIAARIKEREEAKEEFEQAKSEGESASLLEQQRPNVFTMNLSNLMPGQTICLKLHYTELIHAADGIYQFVFPTVAGPRYATPSAEEEENSQWTAVPYLEDGETASGTYSIDVNLSTGVPITGLSCKSHEVDIAWDNHSNARVTLSDPKDFAGNRDYILEYRLTGEDINCGLMLNKGEAENFFMLMVQPPQRCEPEDIPPRDYTFVVDVSGSMDGYPLDTAKELIRSLVTDLKETDTFNVILFSGASTQLSSRPLPATEENVKAALELVEDQVGAGGTELAPALEKAIGLPSSKDAARSIVIITDGYISGETEIFDMIHENLGAANFFSFGIGGSVNRYLIEGIAKTGGGESFVVTDSEDAAVMAEKFRTYIQSPVLTGIQVTAGNFDVYDVEPVQIPTLFAEKPIVMFGKWRGEPTGTIHISGQTGSGDYEQEIQVSESLVSPQNQAIGYLWARTRVERLMDYGFSKDDESVKEEVTAIGLNYSMMTPYTSFIAVLETVQNTTGENTDVDQPQPLPAQVSSLAVGGGYLFGSEPDMLLPFVLAAFVLAAAWLFRYGKKGGFSCGTQSRIE